MWILDLDANELENYLAQYTKTDFVENIKRTVKELSDMDDYPSKFKLMGLQQLLENLYDYNHML